ncbi:hypothetical protein [Streptomyces sp. UNOB3_S3]|uniref:hypothetical protein n=1 Tax=Streptomyces sp. UNOB3_S3 TaxID=2871682 RepID=UPI001E615E1A|nr:hypothetical protein [Streptomyces sp. UNOB3_S3]
MLAGFEADLRLHRRTGGYFKVLTYVISTAALIAIRSGSENIPLTTANRMRSVDAGCRV